MAASADPDINFSLHCIELYDGDEELGQPAYSGSSSCGGGRCHSDGPTAGALGGTGTECREVGELGGVEFHRLCTLWVEVGKIDRLIDPKEVGFLEIHLGL